MGMKPQKSLLDNNPTCLLPVPNPVHVQINPKQQLSKSNAIKVNSICYKPQQIHLVLFRVLLSSQPEGLVSLNFKCENTSCLTF